MKAFLTGASGFIGGRVARKLLERGYDVHVLARSPERVSALAAAGAHVIPGDILDRASMREGMTGSDVVFHVAGWYKIGGRDGEQGYRINVDGTRETLSLAHELGVPKIVYTSTVAVLGDTYGQMADEEWYNPGHWFPTQYDRSKWMAHYQVALPLIRRGAPITVVMPGGVFGPGDSSLIGEAMRLFYLGQLPLVPGPDTLWTYAYVDDIADGHILAAEKGRIGESYVLAGPALSLGEIVRMWSEVSGRPVPLLWLPSAYIRPFAPLLSLVERAVPLPAMLGAEAARDVGMSYLAKSDKARRELGWRVSPLEGGLAETFAWLAESTSPTILTTRNVGTAALALGLLAFALGRGRRRARA